MLSDRIAFIIANLRLCIALKIVASKSRESFKRTAKSSIQTTATANESKTLLIFML
jgi:hypothetical protein